MRLRLLVLFFFSASLIGWAQGRSGSGASSSSSSSSGSATSSHSSGSSGGSSSHSAGGSSGASHSSAGSRSSAGSSSHASHASNAASYAGRDGSTPSRSKVDGQGPITKPHNWLTRLFTRNRQRPELAKAPKPCVGKNCPPPPPQQCKGQKCPPPPPACGPGAVSNGHGGCVATYNARNDVCTTNPQAPGCLPSQGRNLHDNCAFEQSQLQRAILDRDQLLQAMNIACTADLKGADCVSLTQKHSAAESKVELLRQRLNACRF